jgi:PIN domain
MNIYCETNFILEIIFAQEQADFCKSIMTLCKKNKVNIIIPAYSFAEAIYRIESQTKLQENFKKELNSQTNHFSRTSQYTQQIKNFRKLDTFLTKNKEELNSRFEKCRKFLVENAKIIPFDHDILETTKSVQAEYDLTFQDSIIFTSILSYLQQNSTVPSCFLNRNAKDFDTTEIKSKLTSLNCKLFTNFENAFKFIDNQIQ